jgi:hypothetical protein
MEFKPKVDYYANLRAAKSRQAATKAKSGKSSVHMTDKHFQLVSGSGGHKIYRAPTAIQAARKAFR